MNELQAILIVITFVAGVAAFYFAQRAAQTAGELKKARELADANARETTEAQKKLDQRANDLDQTRKQLQDTRNKVERLKKELHTTKSQNQAKAKADAEPEPSSAAGRVRITSQELDAEHRRRVEKLEAQVAAARADAQKARDELGALKKREKERKAEAEKAARALLAEDEAGPSPDAEGLSPEAQLEAATKRLEALQQAAATRERELKKKLNKADSDARAAQKRASNNHALYLVIKGQLEVLEDRLALLRRKYEGAKRPDELVRAQPSTPEPSAPEAPTPEPEAPPTPANDGTMDDLATIAASAEAAPEAVTERPTEAAPPGGENTPDTEGADGEVPTEVPAGDGTDAPREPPDR